MAANLDVAHLVVIYRIKAPKQYSFFQSEETPRSNVLRLFF
uniref:Uncharacterized protein n=1 Tax=Nelumbo nucifera TaxID=4432 RepID=A0A822ZL42_NELNU|nr:TPA_asm: hypothetical protein HUJ06_002501 [Nelumbo nucifera]